MAHNVEPMDVDCMDSEFDDKENTYHHSNLLPCTEKGYEELDVSELNMKLRYSITPAASPMSKSYTAYTDNRNLDSDDSLNCTVENNLTRSLNATVTKGESNIKSLKTLPLQSLPNEIGDRTSVLRPLDTTTDTDVTVTINEANEIDENLSIPSTSSSVAHTPEATTPVNDIKNDSGSPIMRGLKSVLNMFRPSQSPIPPTDGENAKPELSSLDSTITEEKQPALASTPIAAHRKKDETPSRKSSPLKDSITFKDDLEKELQWKDETTIFFSDDKIPIHKLFFQNTKPLTKNIPKEDNVKPAVDNLNSTVEYMDISYNNSMTPDRTLSEIQADLEAEKNEAHVAVESDGEFVDCETTITNESQIQEAKEITSENKDPLLGATAHKLDSTHNTTEKPENDTKLDELNISCKKLPPEDNANLHQEVVEDTNSTVSIIQELDSLIEGNDSKKDIYSNKNDTNEKIEDQKDNIPDSVEHPKSNPEIDNHLQCEETIKLETKITMDSDNTQSILPTKQQIVLENQDLKPELRFDTLLQEEKPADVPLPDEDDIDKELKSCDVIEAGSLLQKNEPDMEIAQADISIEKEPEVKSKTDTMPTPENIPPPEESVALKDVKMNNDVLKDVDQSLPDVAHKKVEGSEVQTPVIESMDVNETIQNLSVAHDLISQIITSSNELEQTQNAEHTQEIAKEIIIKQSALGEQESMPMVESLSINQLDLSSTVPNIEQNASTSIHCDVNSINTANKTEIALKDTTVCIPNPESNGQIDVAQEILLKSSINVDSVERTVNNEETVVIGNQSDAIKNEDQSEAIKNDLIVTNVEKVVIEENVVAENIETANNTTVQIDNKIEVGSDVAVEIKEEVSLEQNVNNTVIIDTNKSVENCEIANLTVIGESKLDVAQEHLKDTIPSTDTTASNESVNKREISETYESPNTDVEIIVSENNSPYVFVMAEIDTEPKVSEDNFETIENTFTSPTPSSPPIVSKGYNFNFDEIDDPFATKTKIRLSPPPNTPSKDAELKNTTNMQFEMPKKVAINRRKSQPPERKKTTINKKKLNTTIDAKLPNDILKPENEAIAPIENLTDLQNEDFKKVESLEELISKTEMKSSLLKDINDKPEIIHSGNDQANDISPKLEEVKLETKSSCESSVTNASRTSSSEQSIYVTAVASSTESFKAKNVFNLPEIEDVNFNPFATKSKMRQSPPPLDLEEDPFVTKSKIKTSPDSSMVLTYDEKEKTIDQVNMDVKDKMDIELMEKEVDISNATSSKTVDGKNITQEINTEDEDTEEGPVLEAEDSLEKTSLSGDGEFNNLPPQNEDNTEAGEMFIDAEAFEFLLNQNKTNIVADSGKESLFLKFDPLFAKRITSDGVVAALSKMQKRQSTPTKTKPSLRNDASPVAGPSNVNVTHEANLNASADESNDDLNITVTKPTMVVNPAVNPAVTPRNKSITPNRSNRRSIAFTSPAMAVIDRLLSMSSNNSFVDTTMTQSQNEADVALTQLRELLAEKEIDVYNLRAESMELKERLNTMESQVKVLEADGEERLKKINDLNTQLVEKSKLNKSMAAVVEEYERTIASLIAETEQDKKKHAEERMRLINERDEQTAHLASMEVSFSDLHSKYEKSKQVILNFKANEEAYEKSIKDFEESKAKMQNTYEMLKQHATSKLNHANLELEKMNKAHEAEVLKLNALLKRNALHITSLEETLAQKTKANDELTAICDELINKVG